MTDQRSSDVLGALPHSRPHRRSDKRGARPADAPAQNTGSTEAGSPARARPRATSKPKATPAKAKSTPRTQAKSTPRAQAKSTPRAPDKPTQAGAHAKPAGAAPKRPATRRTGSRTTGTRTAARGSRLQQPAQPGGVPRTPRTTPEPPGHDLLGTAVQAAAELAEIGLTVGARALRSAVSRLPRP